MKEWLWSFRELDVEFFLSAGTERPSNTALAGIPPNYAFTPKTMFTRDRSGTDPVRFSDRIALLFTRDRSGTGPERIQNWTCCFAGPVSDPIRTGSRTVPCKHLDRFHTVPCKQKLIRSGPVRNGSGLVPCKRSLSDCIPYLHFHIVDQWIQVYTDI